MDIAFYVAAAVATLISGISKGGFGGGIGGIAVPIMSLAMSPIQAVAIMAPILILMDFIGLFFFQGQMDRRIMRIILPAGVVGSGIGWALFSYLDENWIRILLGLISVVFVAWNIATTKPVVEHPSRAKGWFWAAMSGVTSFVAHAGSPPIAVYLLGMKIDKATYVGTITVFFMVMNLLKVVPYYELGLFTAPTLITAAWMIPIAFAGVWAGVTLQRHVSQTRFFQLVNLMLLVSGVKLLYDGIKGLVA